MSEWSLEDAKSGFRPAIKAAMAGTPQRVTSGGEAVVVDAAAFDHPGLNRARPRYQISPILNRNPGSTGSPDTAAGSSNCSTSAPGRYTNTCRLAGSMSQPNRAPFARYSASLACSVARRSVGDRRSMTKSGQSGRNLDRASAGMESRRSLRNHEASGERMAPSGRMYPAEESAVRPVPSAIAQRRSWWVISAFFSAVCHPAGGMIETSPSALRSMRNSSLSRQNSKNCSSLGHRAGWRRTNRELSALSCSGMRCRAVVTFGTFAGSSERSAFCPASTPPGSPLPPNHPRVVQLAEFPGIDAEIAAEHLFGVLPQQRRAPDRHVGP